MKEKEVNAIINNICDKVGIGIDSMKDFVPIFAKYKIINSAFWFVVLLAVSMFFVFLARKMLELYRKADTWNREEYGFGVAWAGLVSLSFVVVSLGYLVNAVEWAIVPNAMIVQYILRMMNK